MEKIIVLPWVRRQKGDNGANRKLARLSGRWRTDCDFRLRWVDEEWEAMVGLPFRAVEGTTGACLVHPEDRLLGIMATHDLELGRSVEMQMRLRLWGQWRWCDVTAEPLLDEFGGFGGCRGVTRSMPVEAFL
jgi:PAS domain-containing protein